MNKTYSPKEIEKKWYKFWEENKFFAPTNDISKENYTIVIPPPNVTGSLHMGHGFNNTIMDVLVRFKRMQGKNTLWQVGTDHAGIATQMVVERKLALENPDIKNIRTHLGREKFVEEIWKWKERSGDTITNQIRRLGSSVDWDTERFTMDSDMCDAVIEAFVQLYNSGFIYRGKRLVNWDPILQTAISDLEVESVDTTGLIWYIKYQLQQGKTTIDGDDYIVIATTRPETLLGDVAIAVHPEDKRYKNLIGSHVILPISNKHIPIIADEYVDPSFGTGCVKITPAHDFNDYQIGKRHRLPMVNIFSLNATILRKAHVYAAFDSKEYNEESLPEQYAGLDRFVAREHIIRDLKEQNLLVAETKHSLKLPKGDRTGTIIEPMLASQWYISTKPLSVKAIELVEKGRIKFVQQSYENIYFAWMRNIEDWAISRSLWWGHRIPAWYDKQGNIYVAQNEQTVRTKYNLTDDIELTQEEDVLDTWFSSGLWTFSTLGWPNNTERLQRFHPTDVLVTGFDIIFFWVARMIMLTCQITGQIPFKTVYVHGLVRDAQGNKMSKSKGNILDPLDIIDGIDLNSLLTKRTTGLMQPKLAESIHKQTIAEFPNGIPSFGADTLRFTFCSLAATGRDIKMDMQRLEGYRNFCNKLQNAANFVLMHLDTIDTVPDINEITLENIDYWILSRINVATIQIAEHLDNFRFDLAAQTLYEVVWDEFCAWYLELVKPSLWNKDIANEACISAKYTLTHALDRILRLAHPFIPFITEDIWQELKNKLKTSINNKTIMLEQYPVYQSSLTPNIEIDKEIGWLQGLILGIRQIRGEMNIPLNKELNIFITNENEYDIRNINKFSSLVKRLVKINNITFEPITEASAIALVGDMKILVPISGSLDKNSEIARLQREIAKLQIVQDKITNKLSNVNFVEKAPVHILEEQKQKSAELGGIINNLKLQLLSITET